MNIYIKQHVYTYLSIDLSIYLSDYLSMERDRMGYT